MLVVQSVFAGCTPSASGIKVRNDFVECLVWEKFFQSGGGGDGGIVGTTFRWPTRDGILLLASRFLPVTVTGQANAPHLSHPVVPFRAQPSTPDQILDWLLVGLGANHRFQRRFSLPS